LKKDKRILLLTPGFPVNEQDDLCIPALQLFCLELLSRKVDLTIVSVHYPYEEKSYKWNGIAVHAMGGKNKRGLQRRSTLKNARKKIEHLNEEQPFDLIHSFWLGECAGLGEKLATRLGLKHVCTLMGQDVLPSNRYLKKLKTLPYLITLSTFHHDELQKNATIESLIIPWGVEVDLQHREHENSNDLITVGWLNNIKQQHQFIHLISELKKTFPNIKSKIVGEGELEKELKGLAQTHGLQENVVFTGSLNRRDTLAEMAKSKALVHTSQFESFGMVLIEALSQKTKVFSTPVGIAPEIDDIEKYHTFDELVEKVIHFLQGKKTTEAKTPLTIKSTVDHYLQKVYLL